MTTTGNLYQAKTQLSKLVERAAAGEEIVIAKAGKPMARLVAIEPRRPRESGFLKGISRRPMTINDERAGPGPPGARCSSASSTGAAFLAADDGEAVYQRLRAGERSGRRRVMAL